MRISVQLGGGDGVTVAVRGRLDERTARAVADAVAALREPVTLDLRLLDASPAVTRMLAAAARPA